MTSSLGLEKGRGRAVENVGCRTGKVSMRRKEGKGNIEYLAVLGLQKHKCI